MNSWRWMPTGWERCLLCQCHAATQCGLCSGCHADLPRHRAGCRQCGDWLAYQESTSCEPDAASRCPRCREQQPHFSLCWTAFRYEFPIKQWIQRFKQPDQAGLTRQLSALFCAELPNNTTLPDALVPVPMHARQWRKRGHNPAGLLADGMARELGLPQWNALIKTRSTTAQKSLNRTERMSNLDDVFSVTKHVTRSGALRGRHVAIIDDVYTTGATANVLAQSLRTAGAHRVDIWALARTPYPDT